jgi:hypothetical protein
MDGVSVRFQATEPATTTAARARAAMFIRFVLPKSDPESTKKQGILVAAHELRDEGDLTTEEHQILRGRDACHRRHAKQSHSE